MGMYIRVEKVELNSDKTVKLRWDCGHKHRALAAATRCARQRVACLRFTTSGVEQIGVVWVNGEIVSQHRTLQRVAMRGRTATMSAGMRDITDPGSDFWIEGLA